MPEAVIVATSRTPIGRAVKGSLVDVRPDDMSAFIIGDVLGKVPQIDGTDVEDVMWGCAQPAGEAGYNIARLSGLLAGLDVPGVTVNRYCSSSLQTIRMAAHAVRAGEGDVFVSGGVECVSRFAAGAADRGGKNDKFADAEARSAERSGGGTPAWEPPEGLPDIYIAMGQTAENVAQAWNVSRERQDEFGVRSQNRAEAAQERGFFEREITPYPLADGTLVTKDDGIRAGTVIEKVSQLNPVFPPRRHRHCGQCLPAQRRGRRGGGDERHQGRRAGGQAAGPDRGLRRGCGEPRDHGPRPHPGHHPGTGPSRHDHRRRRPGGDQRGLRRPGHPQRR